MHRRFALALLVTMTAMLLLLVGSVAREPLPAVLRHRVPPSSVEIYDRHGRLLRVVRAADGEVSLPVVLDDLSPYVLPALLAAEDQRFHEHPGVDPLAMLRAAAQALGAGHVVSGASTLTQQLARNVVRRPRTLLGKWREIVVALRIERELDKRQILQEYLSRVEFGPSLRGIEAASRYYFDKPAKELSLAEAAALVAIPRGPTLYDPRRAADKLTRRRDRVLERLERAGAIDAAAAQRARSTPLVVARRAGLGGAEHLVLALAQGRLGGELGRGAPLQRIDSTIDAGLQREVEALARLAAGELGRAEASALSVLVVDNASAEVLAYVGSPDFSSARKLGQNDGAQALRQPGSTLKPFVYAVAMQELGMTAATLLPDTELYLAGADGDVYAPKNYDRQSHGPVRLREALAASLNVPAVFVTEKIGVERVLAGMHQFGFDSLRGDAVHYGPALALGDGEVRLSELCAAYATLAREGSYRPLRYARAARRADGGEVALAAGAEKRVLEARLAHVLTDILSDRDARAGSFGRDSVLALPFPVAVKTGTSKGLRDNWTVGYTKELTACVWVGNFDGRPLVRSSGVTGAAPLFREVMLAAMRTRTAAPLVDSSGLVGVEVCALSGQRAGPDCAQRLHEHFLPGQEPHASCEMHERVRIERDSGLRAGPACSDADERVFERYPAAYASWAAEAHRPLAPRDFAPRCPGPKLSEDGGLVVVFPPAGARFVLDPLARSNQEIVLQARAAERGPPLEFVLDGRTVARTRAPYAVPWQLAAGEHRLELVRGRERSLPALFEVRAAR